MLRCDVRSVMEEGKHPFVTKRKGNDSVGT